MALDPLVSSDAQALIDRGKAEAEKAEPVASYTEQEIAEACIHACISDSKLEGLLLALAAARGKG